MDSIKQAVELAKAADVLSQPGIAATGIEPDANRSAASDAQARHVQLSAARLESNRIVAHDGAGEHGRYYDMLRTQVLQEMDKRSWQFLAVTSPTPACGKTVTACNLAMSIARLPERSVLLVDLDLRKPMLADYMGLGKSGGVLGILEANAGLRESVVRATIGTTDLMVLPGSGASSRSSEWMASQRMNSLLQAIKRDFRSRIVIFDLPPMLLGDDVISILPRMDAVLLVAGAGSSTVTDIRECQKYLQRTPVVRLVVNKVASSADSYYGYY